MVRDLFVNSTILISFISLSQQLLSDKGLNHSSPVYMKVLAGLSTGFLGILLMFFSVNIYSVIYLLLISSTVFSLLLFQSYTTIDIPIIYCICNIVMSFLVYKYVQYLKHLTKLYRQFKIESSKDYLTGLNSVRK